MVIIVSVQMAYNKQFSTMLEWISVYIKSFVYRKILISNVFKALILIRLMVICCTQPAFQLN